MAGFFVQRVFPTLRVLDVEAARDFYVERLGFRVDWEWTRGAGSPSILQVSRDGLALYLTSHEGDCEPGGLVYLYVEDVDEWGERIRRAGLAIETEPRDQPWGNREMRLQDPFGNRLCIATVIPGT